MTVTREDFAAFFAAVNAGNPPFAWQHRLLDHLLEQGRWPSRITAPNGAGKTSAIDVHVFASAVTAGGCGPRLPRRLALVVGRRVLVDDQHERALALAEVLRKALGSHSADVVARVARVLNDLRRPARPETGSGEPVLHASPLLVARLRGGAAPSRSWRDHMTACSIICATPDMWGSRLLFRGYGMSSQAAPREAGALVFDSVVVVDEAHLSGQVLVTARRTAELASVAERPITSVPALQVVETTATPAEAADPVTSVGVDHDDLAELALADRLTRPKPVTVLRVPGWPPGHRPDRVARTLATAVLDLVEPPDDASDNVGAQNAGVPVHTVGCFVNSVPMAVAVAEALRSRRVQGRAPRVVTVCGQTRPADLARLGEHYPELLSPIGNGKVDVIVTTQSLEVGVDLDLAGIVTELAPGSALAQRAGRANRRGLRAQARVVVAVPKEPIVEKTRSGPYTYDELTQALDWVQRRASQAEGMAPWALRDDPPPAAPRRRMLRQRPELADA